MQIIKAATEESLCGDRLSPEMLEAADDLYHMRIPSRWCQLAGGTAPPNTWAIASWFTDLQNRFSHIDRILSQVAYCMQSQLSIVSFKNLFYSVSRFCTQCYSKNVNEK